MGAATTKMFPPAKIMPEVAAALDDDNLLSEILLRLPPQPSSLPRASAVCKRWLSLVSDPRFVRRFHLRHRRNPPLLGYFRNALGGLLFHPTMEAPNRVLQSRFSSPIDDGNRSRLLGCRHGLLLILHSSADQVLVRDPVTGDQHRVATPPGFDIHDTPIDGTVLRAAGDAHHFQVVLIGYKQKRHPRVIVCIYSSETRLWSNPISTRVPREVVKYEGMPAVLARNSLYWLRSSILLELDLCRQSMAVTQVPSDMFAKGQYYNELMVVRADGGGLGLLSLSDYTAQLWKRNTDCDGATLWVLGRTFELGKLLSLDSQKEISNIWLLGYAEENNVVLLKTFGGTYMVQLEPLQCKLIESNNSLVCYPYESVYAAETGMGGERDGADQDMLV